MSENLTLESTFERGVAFVTLKTCCLWLSGVFFLFALKQRTYLFHTHWVVDEKSLQGFCCSLRVTRLTSLNDQLRYDTFPIAINANWAEILWRSYILNPWPVKIELSSIQVFISFSYNKQFCKDVFFVSPWLRLSTEMHTVCSRLSVSRCRAW